MDSFPPLEIALAGLCKPFFANTRTKKKVGGRADMWAGLCVYTKAKIMKLSSVAFQGTGFYDKVFNAIQSMCNFYFALVSLQVLILPRVKRWPLS